MSFFKLIVSAVVGFNLVLSTAAAAEKKIYGSVGITAEAISASASKDDHTLVVTLTVTNTSTRPKQMYIAEGPTAVDNRGHSFFANPNNTGVIGGVYICSNQSACLAGEKERTEESATLVDPDRSITLTIAFPFGSGKQDVGDAVSIGLLLHARDALAEGDPSAKWRTVSLGVPDVTLRGL